MVIIMMINDYNHPGDNDGHDDHRDCDIDYICGGGGNKDKIQIWDHLLAQDSEDREDGHDDNKDDHHDHDDNHRSGMKSSSISSG